MLAIEPGGSVLLTQRRYAEAVCDAVGLDCKQVPVLNVRHSSGCSAKEEASIKITIAVTPEIMSKIARNLEE